MEAEQRRAKHKKAREEFKKMLESKEITVSTKWRSVYNLKVILFSYIFIYLTSETNNLVNIVYHYYMLFIFAFYSTLYSKVAAIFEDDDRFKAIERLKDREDLYDDYITEREKKERSKALEEHKKNRKDYVEFLKSCDFLTASSQWRKVQGRLEADESCLRLEKVDRLEIFQEYIRDLEKDEEEQRKLRAEELRKTERKNRDEFRKLMDEHIASGMLTSKSHWRDYCVKVKESPAYLAVSSNSSGATPKDLFEDVLEELEKQYTEDRDRIKERVKMRKVSILSTWTIEDFKNAIAEDISSQPVSDVNLKACFDF
ncbi:putative FF domain, pre-mRNA-processing factor Prp40 [Helianthus annuus]|nr:putative FF domain, pre-mRNA-processing factor Prp40 [Helianthus annuus]